MLSFCAVVLPREGLSGMIMGEIWNVFTMCITAEAEMCRLKAERRLTNWKKNSNREKETVASHKPKPGQCSQLVNQRGHFRQHTAWFTFSWSENVFTADLRQLNLKKSGNNTEVAELMEVLKCGVSVYWLHWAAVVPETKFLFIFGKDSVEVVA